MTDALPARHTALAAHRKIRHLAREAFGRHRPRLAGALLLAAVTLLLMGLIAAEALFRGSYSTTSNTLSDLGANPLSARFLKPSAVVFDLTMLIAGALILAAAFLLFESLRSTLTSLALAGLGVGVIGVALVPENLGHAHTTFASLAFLCGALAAIASYRVVSAPFRYVAVALGAIALTTLLIWAFGAQQPVGFLGEGGIERWVVYPVTIWAAAFAGYLLR